MTEDKLRLLWNQCLLELEKVGVSSTVEPEFSPDVSAKGNRADVITYILMARIIDQIAYVATVNGRKMSALALHEHIAPSMPDVVAYAKQLKRGGTQ